MKTKKQLFLFLLSFMYGGSFIAQQNTVGAGGEATGSGGTVSYTVGQIDFSSQTGTTGSVHQGVQQPLEFFQLSIADKTSEFVVLMYPNPVVAELQVELKDVSLDQLTFVLTDVNGKLIETRAIQEDKITINMVDLTRANYFLNFIQNGQVVGSYQIVKN